MTLIKVPKIIAHRGASAYAPENTMAAIHEAYALGANWIEFDVMLTKDKQAILMHDEKLNRTTNGRGWVANATLAEIQNLDAGSWFHKKFVDQRVPTFIEVMKFLLDHQMNMNVEIKPSFEKEKETAEVVIELLEQYWPLKEFPPLISSGSEISLKAAYSVNPHLSYGWIQHRWQENFRSYLEALHCVSLSINHRSLTLSRVKEMKAANYFVLPYTVNDPRRAQELLDWGVDGIFTDYPDLEVKY